MGVYTQHNIHEFYINLCITYMYSVSNATHTSLIYSPVHSVPYHHHYT